MKQKKSSSDNSALSNEGELCYYNRGTVGMSMKQQNKNEGEKPHPICLMSEIEAILYL